MPSNVVRLDGVAAALELVLERPLLPPVGVGAVPPLLKRPAAHDLKRLVADLPLDDDDDDDARWSTSAG